MEKTQAKNINDAIKRVQKADKNAVYELHELMGSTPYFIALRYLRNENDAKDLVQDFWYNIYNITAKMLFVSSGFNYLCKTIENMCRMELRKRKSSPSSCCDIENLKIGDESQISKVEDEMVMNDSLQLLDKALKEMTDTECEVISCIFFENKTIRATAQELHRSKSDVDRIKDRAVAKLNDFLVENGQDKNDI